jgi:hypothetical protein
MKKRDSKKETERERRERLLKKKLRTLFNRLSRLEKMIADLKGQTPKSGPRDG